MRVVLRMPQLVAAPFGVRNRAPNGAATIGVADCGGA